MSQSTVRSPWPKFWIVPEVTKPRLGSSTPGTGVQAVAGMIVDCACATALALNEIASAAAAVHSDRLLVFIRLQVGYIFELLSLSLRSRAQLALSPLSLRVERRRGH